MVLRAERTRAGRGKDPGLEVCEEIDAKFWETYDKHMNWEGPTEQTAASFTLPRAQLVAFPELCE